MECGADDSGAPHQVLHVMRTGECGARMTEVRPYSFNGLRRSLWLPLLPPDFIRFPLIHLPLRCQSSSSLLILTTRSYPYPLCTSCPLQHPLPLLSPPCPPSRSSPALTALPPSGRTNDRDDHILRLHPDAERFPCGQCLRPFATAESRTRHQNSAKCKLAVPVPLPQATAAQMAPTIVPAPAVLPINVTVPPAPFEEEKEAIDPPDVPTVKVEVRTAVLDKATLHTSTNGFAEWLQYRPLQAGEGRPGETTRKQYVQALRLIMTVAEHLVQKRKIGDIYASGFDFRQLVMHEQITVDIIDQLRRGQRGKPLSVGAQYKYALVMVDVVRLVTSDISRQRQIYIQDPYDYVKGARAVSEWAEVSGKKRKYEETVRLTDKERRQLHLSNDERLKVHTHCLTELRRFVAKGGPTPGTKEVGEYRDYIIVVLMLDNPLRSEDLYMAQRCHILEPGSPANELATSWVIRLPPELLKEPKVKWIVIHESLRAAWELYLHPGLARGVEGGGGLSPLQGRVEGSTVEGSNWAVEGGLYCRGGTNMKIH